MIFFSLRSCRSSSVNSPKCFFSQDFEGPDRSFGPGYPREWPPDVGGISVPKTSSLGWFLFLSNNLVCDGNLWGWKQPLKMLRAKGGGKKRTQKICHNRQRAECWFGGENSLSLTQFWGKLCEFWEKTRWVRFGTQMIGWEELTELSPLNSVRAEKLTEFGVWNRTLRNRTLRAQRLKKFKILKLSSEIENFRQATHQTPIFVGNSEGRDWNFQSRLKFTSEIKNFNRDWNYSIFGPSGWRFLLPSPSRRSLLVFADWRPRSSLPCFLVKKKKAGKLPKKTTLSAGNSLINLVRRCLAN